MDRAFSGLLLALLFLWVLLGFEVQSVKAATFTVPDYYPTIQAAVNAANSGDVIFVRNGTYNEHLIINKTLMLAGQNRAGVVIDGNETGRVVSVFADNCTITGFTVRGGGFTPWGSDSGIYIASSNNLVTNDNLINNKDWAVWLENSSSNNTVSNNLIANNWRGIYLNHSAANTIAGNNIIDANQGICFESSSFNIVWNNDISEGATGIAVYDSSLNNSVTCNTFSNNSMGVDVGGQSTVDCPSNNTFYHNNFIGNYWDTRFLTFFGTNSWENGYPSGGNYWSDYNGTDTNHDGIGDTPYVINANNTDNYPLMAPTATIPEFPSFLILPFFIITTLLATIVYKRARAVCLRLKKGFGFDGFALSSGTVELLGVGARASRERDNNVRA